MCCCSTTVSQSLTYFKIPPYRTQPIRRVPHCLWIESTCFPLVSPTDILLNELVSTKHRHWSPLIFWNWPIGTLTNNFHQFLWTHLGRLEQTACHVQHLPRPLSCPDHSATWAGMDATRYHAARFVKWVCQTVFAYEFCFFLGLLVRWVFFTAIAVLLVASHITKAIFTVPSGLETRTSSRCSSGTSSKIEKQKGTRNAKVVQR